MAKHYGLEPENVVEFDEGEVNVVQRWMVKLFTSQFWTDLDILCLRHFEAR